MTHILFKYYYYHFFLSLESILTVPVGETQNLRFIQPYLNADHVHQKPTTLPKGTELQTISSILRKPRWKTEIPDKVKTLARITKSLPITSDVISTGLCLDSSIHQVPSILISLKMSTCNAKNLCLEAQVLYLVAVHCIAEYIVLQKGLHCEVLIVFLHVGIPLNTFTMV